MDEYYALQQSDVHPGGCIPMARAMTPEEIAQQEAIRREYADRIWRQDALRAAFEMVRGTDRATDWDDIVKAARVFLAFIEHG